MKTTESQIIEHTLSQYEEIQPIEWSPVDRGLINRTYRVRALGGAYILQRVNPLFDPRINLNSSP